MLSRLLALTFFAVLIAAAPAAAARPDGKVLRSAGLAVTWPLRTDPAVVPAGTKIQVRVRRLRSRDARTAALTFGRPGARPLASKRLRSGSFAFTVPSAASTTYELRLKVGARTWRGRISTPAEGVTVSTAALAPGTFTPPRATPPPGAPSSSTPPPASGDEAEEITNTKGCDRAASAAAALEVAAPSIGAGGSLRYTLTNTGGACLVVNALYGIDRLVDGAWTTVVAPGTDAERAYLVRPGKRFANAAAVPVGSPAGRYRVRVDATPVRTGASDEVVTVTAEFDVTG